MLSFVITLPKSKQNFDEEMVKEFNPGSRIYSDALDYIEL
jgi:hypothetical protein